MPHWPVWLSNVCAVAALLVLLWAGLKPEPIPQYVNHFDKYTHLLGFAVLTGLWLWAFGRRAPWRVMLFMVLVGFVIEGYQGLYLPGRTFDPGDFLMNC